MNAIRSPTPTAFKPQDGTIYVIYDHNRTPDGEVLFTVFTEEDVRAGKSVSDKLRLRVLVDRLPQTSQETNPQALPQ